MKSSKLWMLVAIILAGSVCAWAQSEPNLEVGFKPYGSYHGSDIESVSLMNGNLTLHVPYPYSFPQRGGHLDNKYFVVMNSKAWVPKTVTASEENTSVSSTWWTIGNAGLADFMFGGLSGETLLPNFTRTVTSATVSNKTVVTVTDMAVHTWDGATHLIGAGSEAADASGWHVNLTNPDANGTPQAGVIIARDGTQYSITSFFDQCSGGPLVTPPKGFLPLMNGSIIRCSEVALLGSVTDTNGNVYSLPGNSSNTGLSTGSDSMGRGLSFLALPPGVWSTTSDSSGCSTSLPFGWANVINYPGPNGTTNQLKVCYGSPTLQTNFGIASIGECPNGQCGANAGGFPTTMLLGDGSSWTFNYDSYGNTTFIGLPLGGSISYQWATVPFPVIQFQAPPVSRAVVQRTLTDNRGNSYVWKYQWMTAQSSPASFNGTYSNVVTDPAGNDSVHVFTNLNGGFFETRTQFYQGPYTTGQLVKQIDTTYQVLPGAPDGQPNALPTNIQTTIYPSGKVSSVQKTYDSGISSSASYGKVLTEKEYDWGQGAPGPLMRETDTTYEWQVNSAYLTAHLIDLPASVITKDGNGNRVAETDYTYDEPAYLTASGVSTQHVTPPGPVRGNLTTVSRWLNTTNSFITSHTNWYDTGEAFQSIDPLGHTTTHSYDAAYLGAFSTQTCNSLSQCVSGTYDFTTGLLTSFTNANATAQASGNTPGDAAHTASYAYDSLSRMTSATAPPDPANGGAQAQTTFAYPNPITLPFAVTKTKSITPGLTDSITSTYDGLGRVYKTQHPLPNGTAEVDTGYDGLDRVLSATNPYFTTGDPTYGVIQSQYDALGRVTTTTKQDGSISTVDYSAGNCTTSTDEAGKQRKSCSDGLGRLIEVDEPNPGSQAIPAQGTLTVNGTLKSQSGVGAINAAAGRGSLTITGSEGSITTGGGTYCAMYNENGDCVDWEMNPPSTTYDSGPVTITVNGHSDSTSYGSASTASSIASGLASAINGDASALVNASAANGVLSLTARTTGASTNYSWSLSSSSSDPGDFGAAGSFGGSPASGALSGGANGLGGITVYDAGTVTVTVGTFTASAAYSQTGNITAAAVASALAGTGSTGLNRAGSPVSATASGAGITLTYNTAGAVGNGLAVTVSSQSTQTQWTFSPSSFSGVGTTLSGGLNAGDLGNNPYVTQYQYDALGNMLRVDQKGSAPNDSTQWRTRLFTYDSLGRLLTANNPESGTISYFYDLNGNLLQKVMPSPNQTGTAQHTISFCYDALNRMSGKAYSWQNCQNGQLPLGTAVVSYVYDSGTNGIGHMTSLTDQAGSGSYNFDVLGRVSSESRTIAGVTKNLSYDYNLDGSVKAVHYPSGAAVTYTPDSAGRILSAVDNGNGINYVTGATYGADSGITGFVSGNSGSFAGINNTFSYNKRLQPVNMSASAPGQTVYSIGYDFHLGNGNNGNVWGITNYKDNTRNQSFAYDALNRLASAQNAGTNCAATTVNGKTEYWGNSYSYDAWGNLLGKSVTKCSAENLVLTAASNNQLVGYGYDAAGNMISDPTDGVTSTYDTENRIATATKNGVTTTYTYDDDGNRVEKTSGGTGTLYWYMTLGIVGESDLTGTMKSEYVFFGGERVARKDFPGNAVSYYFSDHLKTASVIADSAGNIKSESDFYPWGGELQFANNDSNHYKFTSKERDAESGLDYFGARYYSNGLGRFITPDWAAKAVAVAYADFSDPQTLNLYTYVRNLPTTRYDPDGHQNVSPLAAPIIINPFDVMRGMKAVADFIKWFPHTGPPPGQPEPAPVCWCSSLPGAPNSNTNKNQNNSQSSNTQEQGRDAQGKFTSKQPGQSAPGADAEKKGLDAVGATKNTQPLSNGRIPDGTMPDGQKVEIKSGGTVSNTQQLREMGEGAVAETGQPLKVVPTNPNAHVTKDALGNPNLDIQPPPPRKP